MRSIASRKRDRKRAAAAAQAAQTVPDSGLCARGEHELTAANTHVDRAGRKHCRDCWAKYGPDITTS